MDRPAVSFERYCADRLLLDREKITRDWVDTLSAQLGVEPTRVLPHRELLDDIPLVLGKAAEFLVAPDAEKLTAERIVTDEMRSIALLRSMQGFDVQEVVREFDELAQLLDGAAFRWIGDYPGTPDPASVGRVFGRLNRVPLLMGQITVGTLDDERNDLLRRLAAAEEQERLRISRELHDHIGQLVTALLLGLKSLHREAAPPRESPEIADLVDLADGIARELQHLATELRPAWLDSAGLDLALRSYLEEWSERNGIDVAFQGAGVEGERFTREVEVALYRVAQEGLTNVLKHAGASSVSLLLERRRGTLSLILEDDGRGFEVDAVLASPEKARRLGLRGMRERISLLGGWLHIESSENGGTSLFARIPEPAACATAQQGSPRG